MVFGRNNKFSYQNVRKKRNKTNLNTLTESSILNHTQSVPCSLQEDIRDKEHDTNDVVMNKEITVQEEKLDEDDHFNRDINNCNDFQTDDDAQLLVTPEPSTLSYSELCTLRT